MFAQLHDRIRRLLFGRTERVTGRRSPKPAIGAQIVCGDVRMTVGAGMSHELWLWLLDRGWREQNYRPDRRRYRDIPSTWVTMLIDAAPDGREELLLAATGKAAQRPSL